MSTALPSTGRRRIMGGMGRGLSAQARYEQRTFWSLAGVATLALLGLGWAGGEDMRYAEEVEREQAARRARVADAARLAEEARAGITPCEPLDFRKAQTKARVARQCVDRGENQ